MRSDRHEKQEKQVKKKGTLQFKLIALIYIIVAILFSVILLKLNVIPLKYAIMFFAAIVLMSILILPPLFKTKGARFTKWVCFVLALALIVGFGVGTKYMGVTLSTLKDVTSIDEIPTEDFYVVVRDDATYDDKGNELTPPTYQELSSISGETVGTYMSKETTYSEAKAILQENVPIQYAYEENAFDLMSKLLSNEYNAILVSAATYQGYTVESETVKEKTRILYTIPIEIVVKDNTTKVDVTKESFNIYISGADADNSRADVNMVATVNPVKHEVLLTSIPRDYYVELPTKASFDKLTHASLYGVQESIGAIENLLGIDINYYVKVNYNSLVNIIDAIGGVDVVSEYTFTTSGMAKEGLNGYHFVKGNNHLDGRAALAFSRERHSFSAGDMQRNKNQQLVLEAVIKKATQSSTILTSYGQILSAVNGNFETNMSQDEMSAIIKKQLEGMPSWNIDKQSIVGVPSAAPCYALGGMNASIVKQDPESNALALDGIIKAMMIKEVNEEENNVEN